MPSPGLHSSPIPPIFGPHDVSALGFHYASAVVKERRIVISLIPVQV